jgi:hypothetical protein
MLSTKTKTIKSLFILPSIGKLGETTRGLSFCARQAYTIRDFKSLRIISERLLNLSDSEVGSYYKALSESKNGKANIEQALRIFRELCDSPSIKIRAASLLAVGRKELLYKNYSEAKRFILESSRLAALGNLGSPLTFVNAQNALSILLAEIGAIKESLEILKTNEPLVKLVGFHFPSVLGEHHNNTACSLLELGELSEASYYSDKAIANPAALNYPEWFDTKKEIDEKLDQKRNRSFVSPPSESFNLPNVVRYPFKRIRLHILLLEDGLRYQLLEMDLNDTEESLDSQAQLLVKLDKFTSRPTGIILIGFISQDEPEQCIFKRHIERHSLNEVMQIVNDFRDMKLPPESDEKNGVKKDERESLANALKIFAKIKPMLDEDMQEK